ncbi:MAG TPA: DUF177 domain-containing protein [Bacteroidales bacterium]|nr:DUF177 domain-containing protein [Bacteroidales bacterium]
MGKFDSYKIHLKSLSIGDHTFDYILDTTYFKNIDSLEVQNGNVLAKVLVRNNGNNYELIFNLEGTVKIPCDRCLDDMDQPIVNSGKLYVKFGTAYAEEGDDIIIIPEVEGEINIAWFLYEFVALSIPIKHIHAPGKCNRLMSGKLKKHLAKNPDDDDDDDMDQDLDIEDTEQVVDFEESDSQPTDPRWDELKKIIDNN